MLIDDTEIGRIRISEGVYDRRICLAGRAVEVTELNQSDARIGGTFNVIELGERKLCL